MNFKDLENVGHSSVLVDEYGNELCFMGFIPSGDGIVTHSDKSGADWWVEGEIKDWKLKPKERKTITLTEHIVDGVARFLADDNETVEYDMDLNKCVLSEKWPKNIYHIIKAPNARTITLDAETFEVINE